MAMGAYAKNFKITLDKWFYCIANKFISHACRGIEFTYSADSYLYSKSYIYEAGEEAKERAVDFHLQPRTGLTILVG